MIWPNEPVSRIIGGKHADGWKQHRAKLEKLRKRRLNTIKARRRRARLARLLKTAERGEGR